MTNTITIFGCGAETPVSQGHLRQSIEQPVPDAKVVEAFPPDRYGTLLAECRTESGFFAWAAPDGLKRHVRTLKKGDVVLFGKHASYRYIAVALSSATHESKGAEFWTPSSHTGYGGRPGYGPYSHVFFVSEPENLEIHSGAPLPQRGIRTLMTGDAEQIDQQLHRWFGRGIPLVGEAPGRTAKGLVEDAAAMADHIARRGESAAHRLLKERIAENPALAGLPVECKAVIEYRFPSGDKADVAFEYPDGRWVMVEVELEGLVETTIGLFQAVKYKALQEAVLRANKRSGAVIGALVAHRVEAEIQAMALDVGIHIGEVPRS
jgi:hypothetical protein